MKFHRDAASSQKNHEILCLNSNLTDHSSANAEMTKVEAKIQDDGDQNNHSRNKGGVRVGGYSEVFLKLMNESEDLDPFQKNALLKFGINNFQQAHNLYQASFRAAMHMGDMELFTQGLRTIADILMNVETSSYSGVNQSKMSINGLSILIKSAEEILKANEMSEDEHAMLLGATFSRHASMKLMFTLFHSPLFHKLVMESGEKTKIGKEIIFHCIRDLALLCKSMELLRRLGGSGQDDSTMLDQALNILRDCKDKKEFDQGLVPDKVLAPSALNFSPVVGGHAHYSCHGKSSTTHKSANATYGIKVHKWLPFEAESIDEHGVEFNLNKTNNVIDTRSEKSKNTAPKSISIANENIVKQDEDKEQCLSVVDHEREHACILSEEYNWIKGVCSEFASTFLLLDGAGRVVRPNKKPYKSTRGTLGLRCSLHHAICFALLFVIGGHAHSVEDIHELSNSNVWTEHPHKQSSSLRHRSVTDKADSQMRDQEGGNAMRDLSVTTFSNKTGFTSDEYIELNFTSTAYTSMSSLNIFDAAAGSVDKGDVPKFVPTASVNTQTKLPTQLKMVAQVGMDILGAKSSDSPALPKRRGVLTHSDFGGGFNKVSQLVFDDLGSTGKKEKKSLVFKRMNVNVPMPQIWKMDEKGILSGEVAQVWYGQGQNGSAVFMANKEGGLVGSLHDEKVSYSFLTEYDVHAPIGNITAQAGSGATQSTKYTITKLNPVVAADLMGSMTPMIVGTDNITNGTEPFGNPRRLQANCDDVEGYYGTWKDSRGFTCATYTSNRRLCSFTGTSYGLTPQQACCACGGGVILVDVMVVDDTSKSTVEVLNVVNLSIFQANLALSNSGTRARLRLVHVFKSIRPGLYNTGKKDDILNLLSKDINVNAMRDMIGADLVHAFTDYNDSGQAYVGGSDANAVYGYIGFSRATQAGTYLYAHEAGHTLGCLHDRETTKWEDPNHDFTGKYNYGYRNADRCYEDIMSYPPSSSAWHCFGNVPRILQYSNIKNHHTICGRYTCINYPTGTTESDCARAIDNNAPIIANHRKFFSGWLSTVKLCKHPGCLGGSYHASPFVGDWKDMPEDLGQDQVTEIYIPRGLYIEFFEHGSFTGWKEFEGSPDFNRVVTLSGRLNDSMSSFRVRSIPVERVRLCKHLDCNAGSFYASVGKWSSMPWEIGNDSLTMIYLPKGFKIDLFEHNNFGGWSVGCTASTGGAYCSLANTPWNDQASSFKISLALF